MLSCECCKDPIEENNINSFVTFTLGNTKNGNFIPIGSIYYHRDCLKTLKPIKTNF